MTDLEFLALASDLAARAAAAILAVRAQGFHTTHKADDSPVTAADHAAEAVIVAGLRQATPDIPVIAEEEVAGGRITAVGGAFWLVDPLDGTREFAGGQDEFTVNIGLVRAGVAVLGAVAVPALGELYTGLLGHGAWRRHGGQTRPIATRQVPPGGVVVLSSRFHGNAADLAPHLAGHAVAERRVMGSALKFLRVAEGAADFYPRFGRTMEWDIAAPHAVLAAAGGHLRCLDGREMPYGKPGFENPDFICTGW